MGMFDYVEYEAPCVKCGHLLRDFQSKSGECMMLTLKPKDLGKGRFYDFCPKCETWNEYEVSPVGDVSIKLVEESQ